MKTLLSMIGAIGFNAIGSAPIIMTNETKNEEITFESNVFELDDNTSVNQVEGAITLQIVWKDMLDFLNTNNISYINESKLSMIDSTTGLNVIPDFDITNVINFALELDWGYFTEDSTWFLSIEPDSKLKAIEIFWNFRNGPPANLLNDYWLVGDNWIVNNNLKLSLTINY